MTADQQLFARLRDERDTARVRVMQLEDENARLRSEIDLRLKALRYLADRLGVTAIPGLEYRP